MVASYFLGRTPHVIAACMGALEYAERHTGLAHQYQPHEYPHHPASGQITIVIARLGDALRDLLLQHHDEVAP